MKDVRILAIETSCDETAAAVVKNGREVLSNIISSQIALHTLYGGVVPEIASRKHIEKINQVIEQALAEADVTLNELDAIGVTYGPGLVGALLVGVAEAKAISYAKGIPLVGVHHIEGHISANYIENPDLEPPFGCLVVSGGHTHLVAVKDYGMYEYKDGRPFDWDEVFPGFTTNQDVRNDTYVCQLTDDGKAVAAYPKNRDALLAMYEERDPRMMQTVIMPYTTYDGWVNNAPKTCEFVIASNGAPNEVNGFIRVGSGRTESYLFRKFVPVGNMNGEINNREDTPINFPLIRLADVYLMYAECENEL